VNDFMHRYAEGVPFERHYQGAKFIDELEAYANKHFASKLGAQFADVRPISGAIANMAAYGAFTKPGDLIAALPVPAGAHSSHTRGGVAGLLGLRTVELPFDAEKMTMDSEAAAEVILDHKPKLTIIGASLILFPFNLKPVAEACEEIDCVLVYDAAHVLGLIYAGFFQQPLKEGARILTSSTHKTFPGPQGGIIAGRNVEWKKVQRAIFPKILSNHHLHRIPALLIAAFEMDEFGRDYARQIVKNAKALARELDRQGMKVLGKARGYTETHQVVIDVSEFGGGKKVAENLERANIIANKNLLPYDELSWESVENPSGIRLGVQELTRFGMKEREMRIVGEFIARVVKGEKPESVREEVVNFRSQWQEICYTWKGE